MRVQARDEENDTWTVHAQDTLTSDPTKFSSLSKRKSGNVTFGDNSKGKIVGIDNIGGNSSSPTENFLLVDNLSIIF